MILQVLLKNTTLFCTEHFFQEMLWPLTASRSLKETFTVEAVKVVKRKHSPYSCLGSPMVVVPNPLDGCQIPHSPQTANFYDAFTLQPLLKTFLFPYYKVFYTVMCTFSRRCCHACFISSFQQLSREIELLKEAQKSREGEGDGNLL